MSALLMAINIWSRTEKKTLFSKWKCFKWKIFAPSKFDTAAAREVLFLVRTCRNTVPHTPSLRITKLFAQNNSRLNMFDRDFFWLDVYATNETYIYTAYMDNSANADDNFECFFTVRYYIEFTLYSSTWVLSVWLSGIPRNKSHDHGFSCIRCFFSTFWFKYKSFEVNFIHFGHQLRHFV